MNEPLHWDEESDTAAGSDEFDEIEGRAAELLARVAAQRTQRPAEELDTFDESGSDTEQQTFESVQHSAPDEFERPAESYLDPAERPNSAEPDVVEQFFEPPRADPGEVAPPDDLERPQSSRRMALPPWQSQPPAPVPDFDTDNDLGALPQSTPQDEEGDPGSAAPPEQPPQDALPPPPAWPPGMPMPQPGWQAPPAGWPPGLPPPPNWPSVALWGVAPEYWPPDRTDTENSTASQQDPTKPANPRGGFGTRRNRSAQTQLESADYSAAQAYRTPPSLDEAEILERTPEAPASGWRRAMHKATGGRINPGISRKERERKQLLEQIRQPIVGDFRIAVLSIKGGVGKTTTSIALGSSLAMVRTDRVVAVDANPDRGTLAERVLDTANSSTVRDLLRDPNIHRYADVRNYTRMSPNRLEVLASEQDPAVAEVFGETDYRRTIDILRHYYNIILTDCGTGIMHSAMAGVLDLANTIVLVSSPAIDAARSASATLDWLTQHGYEALVRQAHVVFSSSKPGSPDLNVGKVIEHFAARCHSTHLIPFDPHLAEGADFDLDLLKPATADAYMELAGAVSERFSPFARPQRVR